MKLMYYILTNDLLQMLLNVEVTYPLEQTMFDKDTVLTVLG